jgi:hypothetical protein
VVSFIDLQSFDRLRWIDRRASTLTGEVTFLSLGEDWHVY